MVEEEVEDDDPSPNSSVWCLRELFLVGRARDIFLLDAMGKTLPRALTSTVQATKCGERTPFILVFRKTVS